MINCNITIFDADGNETQVTYEQLVKKIQVEGIASLHPQDPGNRLAKAIITKYDVKNAPDSIMEMLAKLEAEKQGVEIAEFPTPDDIDDLLYPKGDLNEFVTQLKIKENTDVGASSTGISANSGKQIAYTFDAEPISSLLIRNKETGKFESKLVSSNEVYNILKAEGVRTPEELIRKRPLDYKAEKLQDVMIKKRDMINYASQKWQKFSRFEIDPYTGKTLLIGDYRVSIFETIDTMINLSIDNVKEQKLFLLGIQVNNANAFFSALAMGIPLPDVVLMFKQDIIDRVTKKGRISQGNIESEYPDIVANIKAGEELEETLKDLNARVSSEKILKAIQQNDIAQLQGIIRDGISMDMEDLKALYTNKLNPTKKAIVELILLDNLRRLSSIGNEMFSRSQNLTLLRGYPSSRWKMESIVQSVNELETSDTESKVYKSMENAYEKQMSDSLQNYDEYKKVLGDDYAKLIPQELARRAMLNDTIRKNAINDFTASGHSVFETNALMRLPHFFSAFRGLTMITSLIDQLFPIHSPIVRNFARDIMRLSNMNDTYQVHKNVEFIQREFMKFLSTGLKFNIDNNVVDLTINVDEGQSTDLWASQHIDRAMIAARTVTDNAFLDAIQQQWSGELSLIADKMSDEPAIERVRQGFVDLYKMSEEIPGVGITGTQLALDMFKYAIITQGLYFGRTNMSLVFPETWAGAHSKVLKSRMDKVLRGKAHVRSADSHLHAFANLEALKEVFLYQFLRNNAGLVRYVPASVAKPVVTSREYDEKTNIKEILSGFDTVTTEKDGEYNVYYDLAFDTPYFEGTTQKIRLPKFIRRYDNRVYIRLETPGTDKTYYRILIDEAEHKAYQYDDAQLEESLSISKLADPKVPVIPFTSTIYANGSHHIPNAADANLEQGSFLYIVNRNSTYPKAVITYRVEELLTTLQVKSTVYKNVARIRAVSSKPTTKIDEIKQIRAVIHQIEPTLTNNVAAIVKSAKDIAKSKANLDVEGAVIFTVPSDLPTTVGSNTHVLDFSRINEVEDKDAYITKTLDTFDEIVETVPETAKVFIHDKLLDPLYEMENKIYLIEVGEHIKTSLGIDHPTYTRYKEEAPFMEPDLTYKEQVAYRKVIDSRLAVRRAHNLDKYFEKDVSAEKLNGASAIITFPGIRKLFSGSQLKFVTKGVFADLGHKDGKRVYAFFRNISSSGYAINLFGREMLSKLDKAMYTPEEFDAIQKDLLKNNC